MAFSLSFTDEFYQTEGDDELSPKDMRDREPTSVYQALMAMGDSAWDELAREVFNTTGDHLEPYMVMDKIRETDTCGDYSSPVDVWIDEEGFYTVDVFDTQES